jgi:transcriptional regulator with XRE-family HTH domain
MGKGSRRAGRSLGIYLIGPKLRALRMQKGLTLSRLAVETGLSTALLSKLETDRMIPTMPTLAGLCRVFGVGLGFFFADAGKHSMSITRKLHEKERGRKHETLKQFPLNAGADSPILAREVDFPPGVVGVLTEVGKAFMGFIYVLEGSLKLDSADLQDVLDAGDCVCLDSEMLITWGAAGKSRCRALVVTSGETKGGVAIHCERLGQC